MVYTHVSPTPFSDARYSLSVAFHSTKPSKLPADRRRRRALPNLCKDCHVSQMVLPALVQAVRCPMVFPLPASQDSPRSQTEFRTIRPMVRPRLTDRRWALPHSSR